MLFILLLAVKNSGRITAKLKLTLAIIGARELKFVSLDGGDDKYKSVAFVEKPKIFVLHVDLFYVVTPFDGLYPLCYSLSNVMEDGRKNYDVTYLLTFTVQLTVLVFLWGCSK